MLFSKRPDVQFSTFQFPRYCNAIKKAELIKNKAYIKQQLGAE